MNILSSTIRDILVKAESAYGPQDAFRYKVNVKQNGKNETVIESKTYTQFKKDTESFSSVLKYLGEQGKHIAILGASSYSWAAAYIGTVNGGSVAVPLDAQLPAKDLCELLDRADVTTLVYDEIRADAAALAKNTCKKLSHFISMSDTSAVENASSMWKLIGEHQTGFECDIAPDSLATIMFTSGTTGKSKGVMLTHRNLAENATCRDMGIETGTVVLSVLPIHHAYCLGNDILKGLSLGSVICINDSLLRVAKNIQLFRPNMILMVPLMIETFAKKLEEAKGLPAEIVKEKMFGSQLHTIVSGGAYLNPDYVELFAQYGIRILQGYGMTECSPVISTNLFDDNRKGSVGKLLPNCEAKIVEEELWVKGSSVMQGYYKMPEETAEALEDGWLKTGDLAYIDEDGYIFLTGRKKNLIITPNGENVSPEEIENSIGSGRLVEEILVRDHEGVIEAEIFPDYEYAKKSGLENISAELQKLVDAYNHDAPLYKRVHSLLVRTEEFPKNTSRKIIRY